MANNLIQIKRTSVSGRAANSTTLTNPGELALNMTDGIMYSTNGTVVFEVGANNTNAKVTNTLTVNALSANGGVGSNNQSLTSNGSSVYWKDPIIKDLVDVAANGATDTQVLTYNSTLQKWINQNPPVANVVYTTGYYGVFYDTTSQYATGGSNTATVTKLANTFLTNGVTRTANNELQVAYAGVYKVTYSLQFTSSSNRNERAFVWLRKNGTDVPDSATDFGIYPISGAGNGFVVAVTSLVDNAIAGDKFQVMWAASDNSAVSMVYLANSAFGPETPSAIVDVSPISNIITAPPGTNTDVTFNDSGLANGAAGFTFNKITNSVFVANNLLVGNTVNAQAFTVDGTFWANSSVVNATSFQVDGLFTANSTLVNSAALMVREAARVDGVFTVNSISANGSVGSSGQALFSDGSRVYWNTAPTGGGGAVVDTAAQYVWSNTHTFQNTVTFGNTSVNVTMNSTFFTGTSNNTSFVGSVSAANVVSNAQLSGNLSNYQTTAGLAANVATLTSNNSTYAYGKTEINLNVNSAVFANSAAYLNGTAAASYVQNTDSRTLSGNLVFSAANNAFSSRLTIGNASTNVFINTTAFVGNVVATSISGNLTGNVTATSISGNLTGNVAATTLSGNLTGNVAAVTISGNLTGNVAATTITGNLTGNVVATTISGNLTGNVTATSISGNLTGNVAALAISVGNSTVNVTANSTAFVGNVVATSISGNLTGNVAATNVSGNLTGNVVALFVSVGNSTVNVTTNSTAFIGNVIATSISGNLTGNVTATTISGNLTGNVAATTITGNLTGNVAATTISGNLTGNVVATTISGNLTGNVVATTVNATTVNATANVVVGSNVLMNTSALAIGNSTANVYVNSTAFVGNVIATTITGNLTGNVAAITITGNLTGNVAATTITGNITGSTANVLSKIQVGSPGAFDFGSNAVIEIDANGNTYVQIVVQNSNTGNNASADLVVTADTGNDSVDFVDLGINNSNYNQPGFNIIGARDAYLYASNGHLAIGTMQAKEIIFHANGSTSSDRRMTINATAITIANAAAVVANGTTGTAGQALLSNSTGVYWGTVSGGGGGGSVDPAAQYAWTNTHSFAANVTFATTAAVIANNSAGGTGQVLTTNGSSVYWSTFTASGGFAPTANIITNTAFIALKDNRYYLTNSSATSVTLPSLPTTGDTVYIVVTNGLSNNVVLRNGTNIMSLNEDLTLDISYYSLGFTYVNSTLGWVII